MFRIVPGDPASVLASPQFSEEERQALLAQYGLTKPLWEQYIIYMKNLLTGSLGQSFQTGNPVLPFVLDKALNTVVITLPAVLLAFSVGPFLGASFSWIRGETLDNYGTAAVLAAYAAPIFWTGMIALAIFSFELGWLPSSGMRRATYTGTSIIDRFVSVDFLRHAVLPLSIFFLWRLSQPTLIMRNNMIDVLGSEFIELKRAEGLSRRRVLFKHAMRNAMLPVVHYGALAIGFAFGGSVILEQVFSWPGVGRAMFQAVLSSDYPVAQGAFFMLAVIIVGMNFFADLISVYLDPRVADEGGLG
jgi:peptide/nickel transport system permease protein